MPIFVLLEFLTAPFKKQKRKPKPNLVDMTPEQDATDIWCEAFFSGFDKYIAGSSEHKTQFWTAGAGWYAKNLKDEQLDLISYLHHLSERIKAIQSLAVMMEEEEVSLRDASTILKTLCSDSPPQSLPITSHD